MRKRERDYVWLWFFGREMGRRQVAVNVYIRRMRIQCMTIYSRTRVCLYGNSECLVFEVQASMSCVEVYLKKYIRNEGYVYLVLLIDGILLL